MDQKRISFKFQPFGLDSNEFAVEKDTGTGQKAKYLRGVASGLKLDGHQERLTEKAINSMQEQSTGGEVLLFADKHGVKMTDDIGRLTKSEIMPNGDWFAEFKLYDPSDGMGTNTQERITKLWKQINGLPPYTKKQQRGFSIEGFIPPDGILQLSEDGRRVIDKVMLDGCVVVPRPAYQTSVAHSIYKALGEKSPWVIQKDLKNNLLAKMEESEGMASYYKKRSHLEDVLEENIEEIMQDPEVENKFERLTILFDEYRTLAIDLIMNNAGVFGDVQESNTDSVDEVVDLYKSTTKLNNKQVLKALISNLEKVEKQLQM